MTTLPIRRAVLSVSNKEGLVPFAQVLAESGIALFSTGGTAKVLREAGLEVTDIADLTGFPEMLDGRVKTLHPKVHGGLLGKRDDAAHREAMDQHGIAPIDLLVVNLYPFRETVAQGGSDEACIENIDIGGPAMIRSAAKNHASVTVLVDPADYARVADDVRLHGGTDSALRRDLAAKAFTHTAAYDGAISSWLTQGEIFHLQAHRVQGLRYGENPHQQAAFYRFADATGGLPLAVQHQGKELSYNNINDTDAAYALVSEFDTPAVAIIKHANPCGVALGGDHAEAFRKALACDPVSAFGGIIALNGPLTGSVVEAIGKLFVEVMIAPEVTEEARAALAGRKNIRVLEAPPIRSRAGEQQVRAVAGGLLVQDTDRDTCPPVAALTTVSQRQPTPQELADMRFAFIVAKHVKSNAIVMAKDGATLGIGAGQMSRVDSVRIACWKAGEAGLPLQGAVMASDAFFPFDDNIHAAAKEGIAAIIQPGGSIRDEEVVKAADQHGMAMSLTGIRHFRH